MTHSKNTYELFFDVYTALHANPHFCVVQPGAITGGKPIVGPIPPLKSLAMWVLREFLKTPDKELDDFLAEFPDSGTAGGIGANSGRIVQGIS